MTKKNSDTFTKKQEDVLHSIRLTRIILPILLGIVVVVYLLWKKFDPEEFAKIEWSSHTWIWIGMALFLLMVRHIAYAIRLRILSEKVFSWKKCIELIFIWEFSSAVSPTSMGGSAVALFVLAQERLSTAKTATIVIYTAILDTFFFVGTLPFLFFLFGSKIIRPDIVTISDIDGWGYTFLGAYAVMAVYGSLFYYGLFINPYQMKRLLVGMTMIKFLRKYRHEAIDLGNDIMVASKEIKQLSWKKHLAAFLSTATAWSCRFLLLNCLIIALVSTVNPDFFTQIRLYARLETMFVIMAFSPTPGGAGFAEIVFGGFLSDYVPSGIALIIAFIWRIITYYSYLLVGVIIIPNWIRNILNERKRKRLQKEMTSSKKL